MSDLENPDTLEETQYERRGMFPKRVSLPCFWLTFFLILFVIILTGGIVMYINLSTEIFDIKLRFQELQEKDDMTSGNRAVALTENMRAIYAEDNDKDDDDEEESIDRVEDPNEDFATPRSRRNVQAESRRNRQHKPGEKSLPGRDGRDGRDGAIGLPGVRGFPGLKGDSISGSMGERGPVGEKGDQGPVGPTGPGFKLNFMHVHGDGSSGVTVTESGVLNHWVKADWSPGTNYRLFQHNGTLQVQSGGVYFIYSQMLSSDLTTMYTEHEVKVNGESFLKCRRSTKVSTCFTSGVKRLKPYDDVQVTVAYTTTRVDMFKDVSFFGVVLWSKDYNRDEL